MYRHLLIATDGSELSVEAVVQGLSLAKTLGAKVTAVVVTEPPALMVGGEAHPQAIEADANSVLAPVREAAEKNGVACEAIHAKNQNPAEGIIQTAQEKGCDLIVMTTHGRRLTRVLMGKQATKVLTYSSIPVLVCR
jgi:nucleotide-binding universal stress UspA family protein